MCVCVFLSVCLRVLATFASPAKIAESIEMPFGMVTRIGPRNHVLNGGADSSGKSNSEEEKWQPIVNYRDVPP